MQIDANRMAENSQEAEAFLKKLANQNRLMILCVLSEGEQSVGELNERVPLSQSALSQHLSLLRDAELVSTRRESQTIYYSIADERVELVLKNLYDMFCAE